MLKFMNVLFENYTLIEDGSIEDSYITVICQECANKNDLIGYIGENIRFKEGVECSVHKCKNKGEQMPLYLLDIYGNEAKKIED